MSIPLATKVAMLPITNIDMPVCHCQNCLHHCGPCLGRARHLQHLCISLHASLVCRLAKGDGTLVLPQTEHYHIGLSFPVSSDSLVMYPSFMRFCIERCYHLTPRQTANYCVERAHRSQIDANAAHLQRTNMVKMHGINQPPHICGAVPLSGRPLAPTTISFYNLVSSSCAAKKAASANVQHLLSFLRAPVRAHAKSRVPNLIDVIASDSRLWRLARPEAPCKCRCEPSLCRLVFHFHQNVSTQMYKLEQDMQSRIQVQVQFTSGPEHRRPNNAASRGVLHHTSRNEFHLH